MNEIITNCPHCHKGIGIKDLSGIDTSIEQLSNGEIKDKDTMPVYTCPYCNESYFISSIQLLDYYCKDTNMIDSYKDFQDFYAGRPSRVPINKFEGIVLFVAVILVYFFIL